MTTVYLPEETRDRLKKSARESGYEVKAVGPGSQLAKFVDDLLDIYDEMLAGQWKRLRARRVLLTNDTPPKPRRKG